MLEKARPGFQEVDSNKFNRTMGMIPFCLCILGFTVTISHLEGYIIFLFTENNVIFSFLFFFFA